jgi:hypothetical protein
LCASLRVMTMAESVGRVWVMLLMSLAWCVLLNVF